VTNIKQNKKMRTLTQQITYSKLDKLKQIQLAMVTWLDNNKDKDGVYQSNSTWKERMTYVLNCEKKDLDKDDIKMLNNLWNHYKK